jgi:D-alanyl-D-alanine carboxypeptidase (penicillin-binding protein 5/6)
MFKRFSSFVLLILICLMSIPVSALPTDPLIEAPSAMLLELKRGQILYSKNLNEPLHIAAASKLMAALIALEKTDSNTMVTASKDAVNAKEAMLDMTVGEKYSADSLIYASMLNNSNDATIALAEAVGGSVESFVKLMNDYAASINMTSTVFVNPTGEYDEKQRTTANDLAKLLRHALTTNIEFDTVFSSQAKPWFDEEKTLVLTNLNEMFWSYEGVDGGKVGYNDPKYQSVITTVSRGQQRLLCLLLDSPANSMYTDSMKLLDHGFNNFRISILASKDQPMVDLNIEGHDISLVAGTDLYYTHPIGVNYIQETKFEPLESAHKIPLYKNTLMGTIKFTLTDSTVMAVDLFPDKEILPELTLFEKMKRRIFEYKELAYIVIGLGIIETFLFLYKTYKFFYRHFSKSKKKAQHD